LCSLCKSKSNTFSTSFGDKKHPETRVDSLFFDFENLLRLFQQWENVKIAEAVVIAVRKHPAKF